LTPLSSTVYGRVKRIPVGPVLSALPMPVGFHDGRKRVAPLALWRLHRVWRSHPSLEKESRGVYDAYEGGDVIDVGAFEGWYSVLLAPKLGRSTMVSCEPDPSAYAELQTTLALLGGVFSEPDFVALPVPVGDGGLVSQSQPEGGHPRFAGGAAGGRPAPTVDGLVATLGLTPGLIKIDVEGAEPFVLRGMRETLATHRPVVMLEVHPRWLPEATAPEQVEETLSSQGYTPAPIAVDEIATRTLWTP
jgi:FkbM family methyltransferase